MSRYIDADFAAVCDEWQSTATSGKIISEKVRYGYWEQRWTVVSMSDYIKKEDAERLLRYSFLSTLTEDERVNELNRIPSADVVEVRHGRWLDRTQEPGWPDAECSVCGSHAGMFWMRYCPNCGAKMDDEEHKND